MKKNKGITLVALVVTIIVLIILAGITLNIVLDQDGIINKTQQAAGEYENAQKEEQELLGQVEEYIEYAGKTVIIPDGYTKSQITTEDDVAEGLVIYEIPEGATVNWTDNQDSNGKNQSTITIGANTTNLQETVNQYVWIPVEDINSMVMCKSNTGDSVCNLVYDENTDILTCQNHSSTATDLVGRLYTGTSVNTGSNIFSHILDFAKRDQIYDESGFHEPVIVSSDVDYSLNIDQLESDFTTMVKSVAKNKGFYVSRYELGTNGDSKKGQTVVNAGSSSAGNWYGLYSEIRDINNNKQMIWGCQYDQIIKFIGEEAQIGHNDRKLTSSIAPSGQNDLDKMKNVYDLEGNFAEWTMEADSADYRVTRSSYLSATNDDHFYPVSYRHRSNDPTIPDTNDSTRSILYL